MRKIEKKTVVRHEKNQIKNGALKIAGGLKWNLGKKVS
jgi:hypothetical protein